MVATIKIMVVSASLFLVLVQASGNEQKVTPVEKVIALLEKLQGQVQAEGKKEAAAYDKFACFTKEQADDKFYAINKSKKKIEMQEAQIKALAGEIGGLNAEITKLRKSRKELLKEQKEADEMHSKEYEKYAGKEKDLSAAIKVIEGAIEALQLSKDSMSNAKLNLRQLLSQPVVAAALALIQKPPASYEYASNDIIGTLQGLLKTFKDNKVELDTNEAHRRHDYELQKQSRENTIKFTTQAIDEKAKSAADKESEKESITQDKTEETAGMDADQAFLDDLTKLGEEKAKEFDQRSKARSAEITAISEALGILKSGVQPNFGANKKLNLVTAMKASNLASKKVTKRTLKEGPPVDKAAHGHWQWVWVPDMGYESETHPAMSFLQVRNEASQSKPEKVLKFLTKKAEVLKSETISTLLVKIRLGLGKDHFAKVRQIIKDLVAKLQADSEAEASQKSFCDKSMRKAVEARDKATAGIEEKTAAMDKKKSNIANLVTDIEGLGKEIAELRKGLFEAEELRQLEKAENEKALAEAQGGAESIKQAIQVLKDYYGFIQTKKAEFVPAGADRDGNTIKDLAPDTGFSGDYGGNQGAAKGIFGFLEVIQADFERTIKETQEAEEEAQAAHDEYKSDTEADIEKKSKAKEEKNQLRETTEGELVEAETELKQHNTDLDDSKKELMALQPMCVDAGSSWKERRAKQKQEIEALKEALQILNEIGS